MTVTAQSALDCVLEALAAAGTPAVRSGAHLMALCPAHPDRNPSLSISPSRLRPLGVVLHCHAGCDTRTVVDALGLKMADLFPPDDEHNQARRANAEPVGRWDAFADAARALAPPKPRQQSKPAMLASNQRRIKTAHWDYHDASGVIVGRVVRFDVIDADTGEIVGKTFAQQSPDASGGWRSGLGGAQLPLYRLASVREAISGGVDRIYVCEGERDADTVVSLGGVATTNAGGAGRWREDHTESLAGARFVVVVADNDEPGLRHARTVAASLARAGIAAVVVKPSGPAKDLTEHVAAGGALDDLEVVEDAQDEAQDAQDEPLDDGGTDDNGDGDGDTESAQERLERVREHFPIIDWNDLWADESVEEWIVEPILPARRLVALYSAPKVGKSLLMLNIAAEVAKGGHVLGVATGQPRRVLYVDFENDPRADVRSRLQAMGYTPDDLANLCYLSFPSLAKLDSARGAAELMAAIEAYDAAVVVVDTVSRAIGGDENENDTWLNFYRHTGLALKQAGVALIRLDHSGKDESKGQRGGSAKSGDVDAVWRLSTGAAEGVFALDCEASRLPIAEKSIVFTRVSDPWLRHQVDPYGRAGAFRRGVDELVAWLDAAGVDDDASERTARAACKAAGRSAANNYLREAVKIRKAR